MEKLEAVLEPAEPRAEVDVPSTDVERAHWEAQRLLYQELFDFAPDGYLVTDAWGVVLEANHAAAALLQSRKEFLVGKPLIFFVAPEHRLQYCAWLTGLARGQNEIVRDWDLVLRPRIGAPVEADVTATAVVNSRGSVTGLRWLLRDVTRRRQSERALRQERRFLDSLLDIAQALVLVLDPAGRILRTNAFLQAVTGYAAAELNQRDWDLILPGADRPAARAMLRRAAETAHAQTGTGRIVTRAGQVRAVAWSVKPLADEAGAATILIAVGHDITDLQEAQRQALQAERLAVIGQLTAALAHEGRNALQRIQGGLERLSWRLTDQPEAMALVARVQAAQRDLTRLFDDIRTFSSPLRLDCAAANLADIWREAWQQATAGFPTKTAHLREDVPPIDLVYDVDRFRLGQVFRNILENALAAGPDRTTVVEIGCREDCLDDRPALRISLRDNGPGLNTEQRARIFEPFYTTKARGTGLGMAIAKRIVEAHGGQITVGTGDSNGTGGAEIVVTIPRSPP
jgi:PAS domain S-box-containing protein